MISLFILILFGIGVALFATQNTQSTSLLFGQYGFMDIPLYAVVLGAMLFGIFVSWLINLVGFVSTAMTLRGKDGRLKDAGARIAKLENRVHELEVENEKLRTEEHHKDEPVVHEAQRPLNPFVKIRQRFS